MPVNEVAATIIMKFFGGILGAALAFLFMPPHTWTDFFRRAAVALIVAYVFGDLARQLVFQVLLFIHDTPVTFNEPLAGPTLAAASSWWLMGALRNIIGTWRPNSDNRR